MSIKPLLAPRMVGRVGLCKQVATRLGLVIGFTLAIAQAQPQAPVASPRSDSAAAGSAVPAASPAASGVPSSESRKYVISPEDVLDVYIYDVPELSREYVVNSVGKVTVPLLPDPIQAAGFTAEEFARELEQSFHQSGRLNRPQITVVIKQSKRSAVTVQGAVKFPQVVPVIGPTRLVAILSQCGGLADDAGSIATITRSPLAPGNSVTGGGPASSTITVELNKLMDGNDPIAQTEVGPGDRVSVEHAGVFYVLGEVNRPGGYNLKNAREQVTILEALSIAGDITSVAKKSHVRIIRKDVTVASGRHEFAINVNDILAGRSPDQTLQANDILYVPSSGAKRAFHTFTSTSTLIAGAAGTDAVYRR